MMWSLIVIVCLGTDDGARCLEIKRHGIADRIDCLQMRNEIHAELAATDPLRLIARCEQGWFG